MTPTQEQIKADVCGLLPGMIEKCECQNPNCTRLIWSDTKCTITPREWLTVAHEAEQNIRLSGMGSTGYRQILSEICIRMPHRVDPIFAPADQRLEAIHRVCFPEKWRGE